MYMCVLCMRTDAKMPLQSDRNRIILVRMQLGGWKTIAAAAAMVEVWYVR